MQSLIKPAVTVLWLFPGLCLSAIEQYSYVVGEAFDINSNKPLYRELHCEVKGQRQTVLYLDQNDELIADKVLDFSQGRNTPSFVQNNRQHDQQIQVKLEADQLSISQTTYSDGEASTKRKVVQLSEVEKQLVIDAGFDHYIRYHWERLVDGNTLSFEFPLVTRGRLIDLRIAESDCPRGEDTLKCFKLEPNNWLIRKIADPIMLSYDSRDRKLIRYSGVSNLVDGDGDGMNVNIDYKYKRGDNPLCASNLQVTYETQQ